MNAKLDFYGWFEMPFSISKVLILMLDACCAVGACPYFTEPQRYECRRGSSVDGASKLFAIIVVK